MKTTLFAVAVTPQLFIIQLRHIPASGIEDFSAAPEERTGHLRDTPVKE